MIDFSIFLLTLHAKFEYIHPKQKPHSSAGKKWGYELRAMLSVLVYVCFFVLTFSQPFGLTTYIPSEMRSFFGGLQPTLLP